MTNEAQHNPANTQVAPDAAATRAASRDGDGPPSELAALRDAMTVTWMLVVESMIDGGVHLGVERATASELVAQTFSGAAKMLQVSEHSPTTLREQVTSPAGTTAAALASLRAAGLPSAIDSAMIVATRPRSDDSYI